MAPNKRQHGSIRRRLRAARRIIERLHRDQSGVAATEYIIVFSLVTFGATLAVIATAAFVKAYRDFLVWWFAHPAI